jgi:uncharacterized membrane protein (DUF485 family)
MEKKSSSMFKPALIYSGIIIGIMIVHTIIVDIAGQNFSTYNRIAGNALPLIMLGVAMYGYRKEYLNNHISYQKALGFGVLVSFLLALMLSVFSAIYTFYINPELIEIGRQVTEEKLLQRGVPADRIEEMVETQKRFQTPFFMILFGTISLTVFGTLFSLVMAAIVKKEPEDPFTEVE